MIIEYENTLRKLITSVIGFNDNTDYKVSSERLNKWKEKRDIESKKNNGILFESRIIFFSDFYDLKTIIDKNWELFLPILNEKKRFSVFFKEIEQYRNTVAHGRKLIKSQEDLLSGILMDLKNSITQYHNRNEKMDDYFIEIIKVSDNIGSSWGESIFSKSKKPTIRVGDEYELLVEANDPKDREIEYKLFHFTGKLKINQKSNRFNFTIDESLIGQNIMILVTAYTPDSEYKNESSMKINLTVLPK
ncbi:hypothetical protein H0I25_14000 [Cellulophaga sp. HaHa_2_95]|uniref:hypothetical protein n=1 Tax=Cellulophaga sp. HaHa_2_95 TaxID=2745558 RepID=UPI001C4EB56C|nr:hypothetical protein [Cellulophaga sp. HaHa_2_95]QXP55185.1 hypothetical protein H0I25_14000 [Cellulophaga sp. HaHa_2_95]